MIVRFDGDAVFDYRSRRPVLDVVDGALTRLSWPELVLRHVRIGGRDLLFLVGAEPDARWQSLALDIVGLVRRLGVSQWVSLGAVPAAVAHTRRVPIMSTASRDGLLRHGEVRGPSGVLRVPAAALSAFEMAVVEAGTPAVGYFAQVPPYAGSGYAVASVALLERLSTHLEIDLSDADLEQTSRRELAGYDAAVSNDSDTREMVHRLESMGEQEEHEEVEERIPSGDELASEIQRFLREQAGDDPPTPGFQGG